MRPFLGSVAGYLGGVGRLNVLCLDIETIHNFNRPLPGAHCFSVCAGRQRGQFTGVQLEAA